MSAWLTRLRRRLCQRFCGDCLFFDEDASREIDRLLAENDELRAALRMAGQSE